MKRLFTLTLVALAGMGVIIFGSTNDTELGLTCTNTFPTSTNSYQSEDCIPSSWANSLETKIGIDGSSDTTSLDYLVKTHSQPTQLTVSGTSSLALVTVSGDLTVSGTTSLSTTTVPTPTAGTHATNKTYVDNAVSGGGAVADTDTAGISILSDISELIAGTATSSFNSTTYNLVPWNKYFNATQSATTTVPVTGTDGKLAQGFIDLSEAFVFTGGVTSTQALNVTDNVDITGTLTADNALTTLDSVNVNSSSTFTGTSTFDGNQVLNGDTTVNGTISGTGHLSDVSELSNYVSNLSVGTNYFATSTAMLLVTTESEGCNDNHRVVIDVGATTTTLTNVFDNNIDSASVSTNCDGDASGQVVNFPLRQSYYFRVSATSTNLTDIKYIPFDIN